MIKERIPISGDLKSKVKQLMEYAGWQEGRKVDISIAYDIAIQIDEVTGTMTGWHWFK